MGDLVYWLNAVSKKGECKKLKPIWGISSHVIQKQYQLFGLSIQVVMSLNKPIVIHCRGRQNRDNCNATDDCINILQHSLHDPYYPIYVHCFTGGISNYMKWAQAFPACMFGFTGALLDPRKRHPELLKVVASMDLGRILLEPIHHYSSHQSTIWRASGIVIP